MSTNQPSPDRGKHGSAPTPDPVTPVSDEPGSAAPMAHAELNLVCERSLMIDGVEWLAFVSGAGAYGTGHWGLASLQTLHFALFSEPGVPLFETLLPAGRLAGLYDAELLDLFRSARKIVIPEGGASAAPRRFSLSDDS